MSQHADNEFLFTSESVTEGHPDKIADQISDGVLDAVLSDDPYGRVACETLVNTGLIVVSGEISTDTYVDIQEIARETVRKIGYTDADLGFSADSCAVLNAIDKQSPDIAQGVDKAYEARTDANDDDELDVAGAGDQGMMFGYATNETDTLMPLPISLAHRLAERLAAVRKAGTLDYLRPDGKTQVSVRYLDGKPVEIEKLLISTQHAEGAEALIPDDLWEHVVEPILPSELYDADKLRRNFLVNPTGRFVIGGPVGDCGLTGRKIIVDTYGGMARHGGGAFSGKDPSKVDRSAAYAARWVAKNIVAAGPGRPRRSAGRLRDRRRAPGVGDGRDVRHRAEGCTRGQIAKAVDEVFDLRPGSFREELKLHRPIYQKTAAYGHFGRDDHDFTWERTDKAAGAARRRRSLTGNGLGADVPAIAQVEPMTTARALRGPFDYRLPRGAARRRGRGRLDAGRAVRPPPGARRRRRAGRAQRGRRGEAARAAARAGARRARRAGRAGRVDRGGVLLDDRARARPRAAARARRAGSAGASAARSFAASICPSARAGPSRRRSRQLRSRRSGRCRPRSGARRVRADACCTG